MVIETHAEEGNESEWWGNISIGRMGKGEMGTTTSKNERFSLIFSLTISLLGKYLHIYSMQHKRWWWWWDEKLFTNSSIERNVKCFHFHSHHLHDFISRDVMCMRMGGKNPTKNPSIRPLNGAMMMSKKNYQESLWPSSSIKIRSDFSIRPLKWGPKLLFESISPARFRFQLFNVYSSPHHRISLDSLSGSLLSLHCTASRVFEKKI